MKVIAVIPARLGSTRLKEKMIKNLCGKPLVWWTYQRAIKSNVDDVIIATDSILIKDILEKNGCKVIITKKSHKCGTERIAEVSRKIFADFYINVQGDEPLIKPEIINLIIKYIKKHPESEIVTVKKLINNESEIFNPNVVKVVTDKNNNALYFSRSPIPFNRDNIKNIKYYKHLGIYCYKNLVLQKIVKLKESELEKTEKLEQLRWLENGFKIKVLETKYDTISVDTEEDFKRVEDILKKNLT
jgi:3-deoxy-manno-octulosonate cytidylyltransferase (CMP-KDO synthetase)